MLARVLAIATCLCLSVRPSVCLSQVGLLSKRIDGLGWLFNIEAYFDLYYKVL